MRLFKIFDLWRRADEENDCDVSDVDLSSAIERISKVFKDSPVSILNDFESKGFLTLSVDVGETRLERVLFGVNRIISQRGAGPAQYALDQSSIRLNFRSIRALDEFLRNAESRAAFIEHIWDDKEIEASIYDGARYLEDIRRVLPSGIYSRLDLLQS